jgi:hypothetical protein
MFWCAAPTGMNGTPDPLELTQVLDHVKMQAIRDKLF